MPLFGYGVIAGCAAELYRLQGVSLTRCPEIAMPWACAIADNVSPRVSRTGVYTSMLDAAIHGQLSPELDQKQRNKHLSGPYQGHSRCFAVCRSVGKADC